MASMVVGLILSFFIAGLGIAYTGNFELGIGVMLLWLILCLVALHSIGTVSLMACGVAVIIWAYSIFTTFFLTIKS